MVQPPGKTAGQFLTKVNILSRHNPAITLHGTNRNELGTHTYAQRFRAVIPITPQTWKQPRCPSIGEWMNKLSDIQTVKYYSVVKINESSNQEMTRGNLKCISLSEGSRFEKATACMILILWHAEKDKNIEDMAK